MMTKATTRPRLWVPPFAASAQTKKGMEGGAELLRSLGIGMIPAGGASGYNTAGDILTETVDGTDLNDIWNEFQESIRLANETRERLIGLLTFTVNSPTERVPIFGGSAQFEEASEFGEPVGIRVGTPTYYSLGYDFKWYDLAVRYTWKFLADATAAQVQGLNNLALDADSRLMYQRVLEALFDNRTRTTEVNDEIFNVYPFYNGTGTAPPEYNGVTFPATHNHYLTTAGATLDQVDVNDLVRTVTHHGYGDTPGMTIMILANEIEVDRIRRFRSDSADAGLAGPHDFIPVREDFTQILALGEQVAGADFPPNSIRGLDVAGRLGKALIVTENQIPAGYVVALVTDGEESIRNPIGIREHQNAALRGLRLIKGRDNDYPLIDSFYGRAFGTGIRHRGAGAVMQVTANATYTAPAAFTRTFNA